MFIGKNALLLSCMLGIAVPLAACDPMTHKETTGEYVDDATITSKVIAAIVRDPTLKKSEVKVATFKSVVQLSGWVDSSDNVAHAGDIARGVKGVHAVSNDLIVR
jgi:osmotically-inducible protein OsmY